MNRITWILIALAFFSGSYSIAAWQRTSDQPILSPGPAGTIDASGLTDPDIIRVGAHQRMYHTTHSPESGMMIAVAESADGTTWDRLGAVFGHGGPGAFDSLAVKDPCVLEDAGGFRMWYAGYDGINWRIGQAFSPDGFVWMRITGSDPSGAAFSLHPTPDRFDHRNAEAPHVIRIGDSYRMVYEGYNDPSRTFIGTAVSTDGNTWLKLDGPGSAASILDPGPHGFDDNGVGSPHLMFDEHRNLYRLFYDAVHYCVTRPINGIGYATSENGLDWTRHGPILGRAYALTFDAFDLFDPSILVIDDRYVLYYTGSNDRTLAIGQAEASATEIRFEPASLDFGDVLFPLSADRAVRVINPGAEAVTIESVTLSADRFSHDGLPGMPFRLEPNEQLEFTVRFEPQRVEGFTASLSLRLAESTEPVLLPVRGSGSRVAIRTDRAEYDTGDELSAELSMLSPDVTTDLSIYILLEAFGSFYSYPAWSMGVHPLRFSSDPGLVVDGYAFVALEILPEIPDSTYTFWAGLVDESTGLADLSHASFSTHIRDRITSAPFLDQWLLDHPTATVLDVRTSGEFCRDHIPGSINISHERFEAGVPSELSPEAAYLVVCTNGIRSRFALDVMLDAGYRYLWYLKDGLSLYPGPYEPCR